jgi:CrcB protein
MTPAPEYSTVHDSHSNLPLDPDVVKPGVYKWPPHLIPSLQAIVFIGGCLGTLARYGMITVLPIAINGWPWATFIANLSGTFILGLLLEALVRHGEDEGRLRLIRLGVGTGFIGAFTTYSSLAVETNLLIKGSHIGLAIMYACTSILGGIIASTLGIQVASKCRLPTRSDS